MGGDFKAENLRGAARRLRGPWYASGFLAHCYGDDPAHLPFSSYSTAVCDPWRLRGRQAGRHVSTHNIEYWYVASV